MAIIPNISSDIAGPLGAIHLPRLWSKLRLSAAGELPEGYDECGAGFDQMVLDGLGIDRDAAVDYVKDNKASYTDFETGSRPSAAAPFPRARSTLPTPPSAATTTTTRPAAASSTPLASATMAASSTPSISTISTTD